MKKEIHISDGLKQQIEKFIEQKAKAEFYSEQADLSMSRVKIKNSEENPGLNLEWDIDSNGKVIKCYWHEGLSQKESQELLERLIKSMAKIKANLAVINK